MTDATSGSLEFEPGPVTQACGDIRQLALAQEYWLNSGQRRVRLTSAGGFDIEILPDRGMDLGRVSYQGIPISFCTPALWDAPPPSGDSETFARRFGAGLLTTCGLDQFGLPNNDAGQSLPQHGRATELPADQVRCGGEWTSDGYELSASGQMRQWRLFGENLGWTRRISTILGTGRLLIEDSVVNASAVSQPHMMLYHINFGYPMLDSGVQIISGDRIPGSTPVPRDAAATAGLAAWNSFTGPVANKPENVFRHDLDPAGGGRMTLVNSGLCLSASVVVDPLVLPWMFQWKSTAAGAYALGLEPANCPTMDGRADARRFGVLPHLEPGEERRYRVEILLERSGQ